MELVPTILASGGDDGIGRVIGLVVLAAFAIIGSVVKKAAQAREAKEAQERDEARRRRQAAEAGSGRQEDLRPSRPPVLSKLARHAAVAAATFKAAQAPKRPASRGTPGDGIREELAELGRHQEQAQTDRQSRLHLADAEAVVAQSQANLSVSPPGRAAIHLHGSSVAHAIILREILSPPKALRRDQEMWDL
ncbi:MAG: hypothetical protein WCK05_06975 [Planctomycetota bacterium]